jgi:cholesterol oxidase
MSGGLHLGSTDTAQGAQAGKVAGTIMSLHATISIDDVKAFIADPAHLGALSGSIDFSPLGTGLPSKSGVFNLFSPTDNPKLKLMVYEMGFQADGKDYYLAGQKNVAEDPIYELWRDTTTLYSLLHEGTDKSGPVIGAGILTLGLEQLIEMCLAMHATNASSPVEALEAVSSFGRFFLGQLWDTYVSKKL